MSQQQEANATNTNSIPGRRLSGVGIAASRFSQRVSTVLKPALVNTMAMGTATTSNGNTPAAALPPPSQTTHLVQKPMTTTGAPVVSGNTVDSVLEQLKYYQKEGFTPPRVFSGGKRISVCDVQVIGNGIVFKIIVQYTTKFHVTIDNGATAAHIESCTIRCDNLDKLSAKGRAMLNPSNGTLEHPAFKGGSSLGGWLPHYAVGVLIYMLVRLVEDDGIDFQDVACAAVGPPGFELHLNSGLALLKGKRGAMEDYKLISPQQRGIALYGVFDGHGGFSAADYASKNIPLLFHSSFASPTVPADYYGRATAIRRSLKSSVEEVDRKFLSDTKETAGSTACIAAIDIETLVVHVANVGDSRSVLCRDGKALDLSVDHKANHPAEIARIVDAGGFVARGRALGLLAISRALGDRDLKRSANEVSPITAEADVDTFVLDPCRDEFMVIACDGLYDVMTSQQVVAFARAKFAEGLSEDATANALACHAIDTLGSLDNVTVIVISFAWMYIGNGSNVSTPRAFRAPTIRRTESATIRAAKASAHKRQTSRMSSTESSTPSLSGITIVGGS